MRTAHTAAPAILQAPLQPPPKWTLRGDDPFPTQVTTASSRIETFTTLPKIRSHDNNESHAYSLGTIQRSRNERCLLISVLVAAPIPPRGQPLDNHSENRAASNPPDAARCQTPHWACDPSV